MTPTEMKKEIRRKDINRQELAEQIGVSQSHLSNMLNGWTPMKAKYEKAIQMVLSKKDEY